MKIKYSVHKMLFICDTHTHRSLVGKGLYIQIYSTVYFVMQSLNRLLLPISQKIYQLNKLLYSNQNKKIDTLGCRLQATHVHSNRQEDIIFYLILLYLIKITFKFFVLYIWGCLIFSGTVKGKQWNLFYAFFSYLKTNI